MRGTQSFLLQLEKNLEILPSTRDDALFPSGVSREISPSLLSLEKVLDTLEATQEVPDILVATRVEHRGSHHNSGKAPGFPLHLEMRVLFPASSGKESRCSRRTSRGGSVNMTLERKSRGCGTIPKTLMSQSTAGTTDSPALSRTSPRGPTQNTMAGMTALW